MKRSILLKKLLPIFLFFTACKKTDDSNSTIVDITVSDAVTHQPIAGALVSIRSCFLCVPDSVEIFSGTTDDNGICHVPRDKFDSASSWRSGLVMDIAKANYWSPVPKFNQTSFALDPMGWIKLRIIRSTNYPQGAQLVFYLYDPTPSAPFAYSYYQVNAAADSTVLFTGFGNQSNRIDWQLLDNNVNITKSGTWHQEVPRFDTVNAVLNY